MKIITWLDGLNDSTGRIFNLSVLTIALPYAEKIRNFFANGEK